VRWAALRIGRGRQVLRPGLVSLNAASGLPVFLDTASLSNSMGRYTTEKIDKALYTDELVTHENVVLNIDRSQAGAGNMPQFRLPGYEVPPEPVQYVVVFRPISSRGLRAVE
jgi:hypothetical protein